ncbi:hypothetical protein CI109_100306 [Kwoniella shandongensis]|uniref:Uncharacterized protein n=1 Tax=Kwoniella shandongensis TaxID=1734106 RepID=A0A5M6C9P2_9TREE|nr:uncharacterized protein CI109_001849 [Kwoniella shandongensis]KAA5529909.1 hypothetical protein CI109_001849 [Kwoniella shandongensis]
MNSYPHEFLAHPQPLMFVAGLTPTSRDRSSSTASASGSGPSARRASGGASSLLDPNAAAQGPAAITTPVTSPSPLKPEQLPASPPPPAETSHAEKEDDNGKEELSGRDKEFEELVSNLRGALTPSAGKGKVWLGEKERRDFRIVLVDKGVRLPMRKVNPSSSTAPLTTNEPPSTPHSPLSPMIPSSPLYPDGLIAPVWVRKHAELVPSVFVLFLRLYESPIAGPGLETVEETQARETEEKAKEKEMDEQLVREIGERRRRLGERGIKLTVVLMASAATLDSPSLDPRLSYLRRASLLSAKASLFVLTPVPADQLPDFVQSLQEALYDSALEYYSAHAKRVRRKRSRVPLSQMGASPMITGAGARALGPQGWAVRYDWKAGWFAEVRGDFDAARRHYEDCWNELAKMFSSTTTLPPRTKRWAEAKVLADCVAVRICKLILYGNEGPKVLTPFFVHLKRFGDLSRGWGIGEETFEFWSWIARQYRIFAELLEMGQQAGLRIASLAPPVFPTAASAAAPPPPDYYATPISSGNPLQVLQQPAFYYYTAACCSIQRQQRFQEALDVETDALGSEAGAASGYVSTAPGFANEKKVDHSALIIELFTKAYSLLKEQAYAQNRVALFVAFRIAETYCQAGQYDMAMRFFDRISQSFKREQWTPIVRQIRKLWYECAQRTGSVESAARLSIEMMCPDSGVEDEERAALPEGLLSLLKTTSPSSTEPVTVEMDGSFTLLNVRAGFWKSESIISQHVPYQVTLRCPENVDIRDIQFSAITISFTDDRPDVVIISTEDDKKDKAEFITVGTQQEASLRWTPDKVLVIDGEVESDSEGEVQIASVKLSLKQGSWDLEIHFAPNELLEWTTARGAVVPVQELSPSLLFTPRAHEVEVDITHHPSAFVGEDLSVEVKVTNNDSREMDVDLSVFIQPGDEDEDDGSTLVFEKQQSSSLLKDISFGILAPSASTTRTIVLRSPTEATKILDLSVQSTIKQQNQTTDTLSAQDDSDLHRTEQVNRTIVIPVLRPFDVQMGVKYTHKGKKGGEALVDIRVGVLSSRGVKVEGIEIKQEVDTLPFERGFLADDLDETQTDEEEVKLVSSSLDGDSFAPQDWDQSVEYAVSANFTLAPGPRGAVGNPTKVPAELVFTWRSESSESAITTNHPLPPLIHPPPTDSFIIPTLHLPSPPHITPHAAFPLSLTVLNTHPTHTANALTVLAETAEGFVWKGDRAYTVPSLAPGEEKEVNFDVVCLGGSGWVNLPRIGVWEGEGEDREEVRVRGGGMVFVRA